MAEIRVKSIASGTIRTLDRSSTAVNRIRNTAINVKDAGNRLEEYGRNSEANGNQNNTGLPVKPIKTQQFSNTAVGFRKTVRKSRNPPVEFKAYQEAGQKALRKTISLEKSITHMKKTAVSFVEKAKGVVRLTAAGSKAILTAFAAAGSAGIACIVIVMIVTCAAVIFEMAGYDENALSSDMDIAQFMENAFGEGSKDIVSAAEQEIGNKGGKKFWKWYGFDEHVEWCACFVSWCGDQCDYINQELLPKFADCRVGMNWFKKKNRWLGRGTTPKTGWIIFFDWGNNGSIDHVGIVEKCENGYVYTIEGNSKNKVRRKTYSVKSKIIEGYGVIKVKKEEKKGSKIASTY